MNSQVGFSVQDILYKRLLLSNSSRTSSLDIFSGHFIFSIFLHDNIQNSPITFTPFFVVSRFLSHTIQCYNCNAKPFISEFNVQFLVKSDIFLLNSFWVIAILILFEREISVTKFNQIKKPQLETGQGPPRAIVQ